MAMTMLVVASAFVSAPCAFEGLPPDYAQKNGIACGWVTVPRSRGSDKTIRLWTAVLRATGPDRQADPLLYINGGPGIATVDSVVPGSEGSKTLVTLRRNRDIIVFDQRGSGRSDEKLCPGLSDKLRSVAASGLTPAQEEEASRTAFAGCRAELDAAGTGLDAYSTAVTVDDMEHLRQAFGVARWNLMSVSYGSLVAMHAMRTRPDTVRTVILNSPYPPNSVTWAEQASSAAAAYIAIDQACATQPACRERFGALVPKLEVTLARLEREPIRDGKKTITGRQFASALWPLAVRSSTVRFVPQAIARAHAGDEALIRKMVGKFSGGDSFGGYSPAQGLAIACHESGRTTEWYQRAKALYPALVSAAPADSFDRLCATFRPGHADPEFFAPVASTIPTLIYAGGLDPATPVVDAYQALRFLGKATLVEVAGGSHAPLGIDECTRSIASRFVDAPEAEADLSCLANREPTAFAVDGLDELLASGS